ncbi:pentapeptide repeat-containing protein [Streptomyces sp. NBC_01320]|uniref:pentapeptide repeat-containing protein n=1 Tax=Streptomyces sp. NBC_01320 TaxID=2903824 RepID=UPI002E10B8BD|nr:pentapeptide repeat-containing protein [Streptomyces sp. NBC_01320]
MANTPRRTNEPSRGRYTPKLWSVWLVAPLAVLVVGAASYVVYQGVDSLLTHAADRTKPPKPVDVNDVIKITITILALGGAVLAGIYAYRKQQLAEGDTHRVGASQLAECYTTAADQLGHDNPAVRLAGVYALARLADDWEEQRQVCIDVLCAYPRMPHETDPTSDKYKEGEREVRHTIIRVIRDHLREPQAPTFWSVCHLDFSGAVFDGGEFSDSHFHGTTSFAGATFSGTVAFIDATFSADVVRALLGQRPAPPGQPLTACSLRERVEDLWRIWQTSPTRFTEAEAVLPRLIDDVEATVRARRYGTDPAERHESLRVATDLYGLLRSY